MSNHGKFHWNELMTWDAGKAKAFYGETLGWTFDDVAMPQGFTYTIAKAGGEMAGGIMQMNEQQHQGLPEHWFSYIETDDIDARCAKVEAAGGSVINGPFDVETVGRFAIVRDANGAMIGWITPEQR